MDTPPTGNAESEWESDDFFINLCDHGGMRALHIALFSLLGFCLTGCGLVDSSTYRFEMVVSVDTPDGIKTGSSVYEVSASSRPTILIDENPLQTSVIGEAVVVEVAPGQRIYALLNTHARFYDLVGLSMATLEPSFAERPFVPETARNLSQQDPTSAPAKVRPQDYPVLVKFDDKEDPTSLRILEPADFSEEFGPGYSLRQITVQISDGPVTKGAVDHLTWLDNLKSMKLEATQFPQELPVGDFRGLFKRGH
ncbi:MAG: hypothetical protein V2I43_13740 [Parvularcula sp.]|nr:hypothetical protein [Parvularcula sp.]